MRIPLIITLFFAFSLSFAQNKSVYMPLNVKTSYEKGIRNYDGTPGPNYWQNRSKYKIDAELFPDSSLLAGKETIEYFNNSPDTLKRIVIRLYQDIRKKGATRDWYIGTIELFDGTKLNSITVNGDTVNMSPGSKEFSRGSTNMFINLKQPLLPGSSVKIEIDYSFEIAKILRLRMGNYGEGDYFIAYWYPQISVYDDIDGWDTKDYQGSVEFYNDFDDYDFTITVPDGYTVWATGELVNSTEVYQPEIVERINKAKNSDETIRIISAEDRADNKVTIHNEKNSFHFVANNVEDVSFCVSDSYLWDAASVVVDKASGRRALTAAVFPDSTNFQDELAQFARASINYLSNVLPGFPYPYPHHTSFFNKGRGGGMETPMMANDGAPNVRARSLGLVFHEITHTYFPFIMGTNERKYAWMDEGWATFFPREVVDEWEPKADYWSRTVRGYERNAGLEEEFPPMLLSFSNKGRYARIAFYNRPATAYRELLELVGRDNFQKAMLEYMRRWNGKHPLPWDFFNTFNDVVKEDLSWFFNPWFAEYGYPDLGIKEIQQDNGGYQVTIEKIGNIPTRVEVTFVFEDGSEQTAKLNAHVWKSGNKFSTISIESDKKLKKVILGNSHIPDSNRENNEMTF
ncbi:MAG: M1 family peptidase [Ignavibacteria bacterium]|nr:MAG: M1 family peptidase [Ignavibacteria bacterium]